MVNRNLAEAIVGSLQLSGAPYDFGQLARFAPRDWERCVGWLGPFRPDPVLAATSKRL